MKESMADSFWKGFFAVYSLESFFRKQPVARMDFRDYMVKPVLTNTQLEINLALRKNVSMATHRIKTLPELKRACVV